LCACIAAVALLGVFTTFVTILTLYGDSLALCMFGAVDFSDKFPTPQEKLLALFERIEIG
jgi:hypothetical protein